MPKSRSRSRRASIATSSPTHNEGLVCLSGCARDGLAVRNGNGAAELASIFGRDRFFVELQRPYERGDAQRNARLRQLAETIGVQTVVTGNVHAHNRRRALLQDAMVAIRNRTSLEGAERERRGNHECVLLAPDALAERFPDDRDAVDRTAELAERLEFDLTQELGYRYPDFSDRDEPAIAELTRVCNRAFEARYPSNTVLQGQARARLDEELALIADLGLAGSSCSTGRCSSSPRTSRARCAGATRHGTRCPRAAGAEARSARSSAT